MIVKFLKCTFLKVALFFKDVTTNFIETIIFFSIIYFVATANYLYALIAGFFLFTVFHLSEEFRDKMKKWIGWSKKSDDEDEDEKSI